MNLQLIGWTQKHLMHLKGIQRQMNMSKLGLNALGSIPKNVGALPPLSDTNFEHAITNSARALMAESGVNPNSNGERSSSSSSPNSSTMVPSMLSTPRTPSPFNLNFGLPYFPAAQQPSEEDDGRINPLAGMGLTDEQYNLILQNIVSGDGFLDGMDNLVSPSPSSSSAIPSSSGVGSSSAYASGDGSGFLRSEPTPTMGMYAGRGAMMGGEKRRLEEERETQHDGEMKRGRYDVG